MEIIAVEYIYLQICRRCLGITESFLDFTPKNDVIGQSIILNYQSIISHSERLSNQDSIPAEIRETLCLIASLFVASRTRRGGGD